MARRIFKYQIETTDIQSVKMPKGSIIHCLQLQNNVPCIWAMVNPEEKEIETRVIAVYGTGHPIPDSEQAYIGTYQTSGGFFVFHVFEIL